MTSQPSLSWTMTVSKPVDNEQDRCFIIIIIATGATVSLEQTRYRVDGGVSEIEVCARILSPSISCPIKFPFEVGLATDHQSAGVCVYHVIITW